MINDITLVYIKKIEKIQQNPTLGMTSVIRCTFKQKLQQHLALGSLQQRQWHRKICLEKQHRKNFPKFLRANLHAICLIRFPNQTVTVKAKSVKVLRNEEFITTFSKFFKNFLCQNFDNILAFKTFKVSLDLFQRASLFASIPKQRTY